MTLEQIFKRYVGDDFRSVPREARAGALALEVVKRTKVEIGELLELPPQVAAEKLIAGEIDAAFIVTGWEVPVRAAHPHCQEHRGCDRSAR